MSEINLNDFWAAVAALKDGRADYVECREDEVPDRVRFDVPGPNQGQIIEVAYGGYGRSEHGFGDLYKRVIDRSVGPAARYFRLAVVRSKRKAVRS